MMSAHSKNFKARVIALIAVVFVCLVCSSKIAAQQGGTVQYFYDDNGRLIRVVLPTGETAVYEYDPAGNFTAIRRLTVETLQVVDFSPKTGGPGDRVTFFGTGFGSGVSQVSFNGATGRIIQTNTTTIIAQVPEGATTGPVTITTPRGSVTTSLPFTIKSIRVEPSSPIIAPGASLQFTAIVLVQGDPSVKWSVNGVEGRNASVGTITTAGFYTAPSLPPFPILVRATSISDPQLFGEAQVTVRSLDFDLAAQANAVSVARQPVPVPPDSSAAISAGISVQRESTQSAATSIAAISGAVSTTKGPSVSNVSPSQIARGATVSLTITGANLTDTATFKFIDGTGAVDTNIAVSNLAVNANGTSLTLTINANVSAALGRHLVIISTSGGNSALFDTGSNTIEITP